jgi:anti-sigma factor RsiW
MLLPGLPLLAPTMRRPVPALLLWGPHAAAAVLAGCAALAVFSLHLPQLLLKVFYHARELVELI